VRSWRGYGVVDGEVERMLVTVLEEVGGCGLEKVDASC
jgi:hypothetical protein